MTSACAYRTLIGERSADLARRARKVMPGGTTRSTLDIKPSPPYIDSGSGFLVRDVDGRELIDLQNNYTALVHGHARREICDAAIDALRDGASFGLPSEHEVLLAECLVNRFVPLERLRFTNSGTEAVMMAIRTARTFTARKTIIRFQGAYHGTYDDVMGDTSDGVNVLVVPFNDVKALQSAAKGAGLGLAAILVDLMPNRAGLHPASNELVGEINHISKRTGALIIVDEVISGRLSFRGLAAERGLKADLATFGKMIGGGFPVGAFGGRAEVMRVFEDEWSPKLSHGGTFTANPVTTSAGMVALDLFDSHEVSRINALGERLRSDLSEMGFVTAGCGSLVRLHSADPERVWWAAYEAGVLICGNGLMSISTAMDTSTIDELEERFKSISKAAGARTDGV